MQRDGSARSPCPCASAGGQLKGRGVALAGPVGLGMWGLGCRARDAGRCRCRDPELDSDAGSRVPDDLRLWL